MRKLGFLLVFCTLTVLTSPGCGTYNDLFDEAANGPHVMGGVRYDFDKTANKIYDVPDLSDALGDRLKHGR